MKSKIRPPRRKLRGDEWLPYFCWRPRTVLVATAVTPPDHHPAYRWVWLEWVERRARDKDGMHPWIYRFLEEEPTASAPP